MSTPFDLIRRLTSERDQGVIVWMLNIGAEKYWNASPAGVVDRSEDRIVGRTEEMNLLLCRSQDILLLRERPDDEYLAKLREWGFDVPRIWVPNRTNPWTPIAELVLGDAELLGRLREEASRGDVHFVPYAVTRLEEEIASRCGLRLASSPASVQAAVNDKIFNRELAERLELPVCRGRVCLSTEEIRETYRELAPSFGGRVIIKEPFGASGKGLYMIDSEEKLSPVLLRLSRLARRQPDARWLVEGWYDKQADLNYQICVSPDGKVDVFSIKRQVLRDTVYIGSQIPAGFDEVTTARIRHCGEMIGRHLFSIGYTGVAGIDAIIAADGTLFPVIEINGRFTLSTYISFLDRILGAETRVFSRYFRHRSDRPLDFGTLCRAMENKGILYDPVRRQGVMAYTSGTLPMEKDDADDKYAGRIFTLIASRDWKSVEAYALRLEALLLELQNPVNQGRTFA